jgi:phage baseplate assembly protein gpV
MDNTRLGGITVASVTQVGVGEHLGCVQVMLSWSQEPRQQWLPVASPMAGANRGWFVMPVVGFLWNKQHKPPSEDPRQRIFCSENGHCIRFIDSPVQNGDKGSLVIEDANGNTIVLSNTRITITAQAVVEIKAPMVSIAGRAVRPVGPPI